MKRSFSQKGEGRLGMLITLIIIGMAIFIAYKIVPVKIKTYEFKDTMRDEARMGSWRKSADETMEVLLRKAKELELPITKNNISINRMQNSITIRATYTIKVDFIIYQYHWHFDQEESAPLF